MDHRVARLKTASECKQFIVNMKARLPDGPELAQLILEAGRHAVELRAAEYGAKSSVEQEAVEAIYALEEVTGKRAGRTWPMVKRHGIIQAVERVVNRPLDSTGYASLVKAGMADKLFEMVVIRHREHFSPGAVKRCEERLEKLQKDAS